MKKNILLSIGLLLSALSIQSLYSFQPEDKKEDAALITLISTDNQRFEIPRTALKASSLKDFIDDTNYTEYIPLNIQSTILKPLSELVSAQEKINKSGKEFYSRVQKKKLLPKNRKDKVNLLIQLHGLGFGNSAAYVLYNLRANNQRETWNKTIEFLGTDQGIIANILRDQKNNGQSLEPFNFSRKELKDLGIINKILILTGQESNARMWSFPNENGKEIHHFVVDNFDAIEIVRLDNSNQKALIASDLPGMSHGITLWDIATGDKLKTLTLKNEISSAEFSHDSKKIVVSSGREVTVWDIETKTIIHTLNLGALARSAQFSKDDEKIITASYKGATIWNAKTGESLFTLAPHSKISNASFSPNTHYALTIPYLGNIVDIWDVSTGTKIATLSHTRNVYAAKWSSDSTKVVSASADTTAKIWDAASGTQLHELKHISDWSNQVVAVSFSHDDTTVMSRTEKDLYVWDALTGNVISKTHKYFGINSAQFTPDDTQIVFTTDNDISLLDIQTKQIVETISRENNNFTSIALNN